MRDLQRTSANLASACASSEGLCYPRLAPLPRPPPDPPMRPEEGGENARTSVVQPRTRQEQANPIKHAVRKSDRSMSEYDDGRQAEVPRGERFAMLYS